MTAVFTATRYAAGAAIVAGGSGGIGRMICNELARAGADIALTYHRNKERAQEVAREVEALGKRAVIGQVDLRDADGVSQFAAKVHSEFGGIHTAIYAAGPLIPMKYISKLEPQVFEEVLGADVFGCFNLIHATLPDLREARGVLLSLATPAIKRYAKTDILSAAPKAAIEALVRGVATEEGRFGVRANCVGVGMITDGMFHDLLAKGYTDQAFIESTKEIIALKRLGSAQEIADVVAFLASDKASYVTGQILMVDGGYAV